MTALFGTRKRLGGSTAASIAIHAIVALAIPALAWTAADNSSIETVSFQRILRIQIAHAVAPQPRPRAVAPHHSAVPVLNFSHRVAVVHVGVSHAAPARNIATSVPAAPAVADLQQAGSGQATDTAPPVPSTPPPARAVSSVTQHQTSGFMPFGAEQPEPVLDPAVRKQLDALNAHVTLVVTVGDDGHTTNVLFQPEIDSTLETRIRALLADASWDPAVCGGGVSCTGQATIRL